MVHNTEHLTRHCPRMMGLLKLFTHAIQINRTHEEIRKLQDAFMVLDAQHYLRRPVAEHFRGAIGLDDETEALAMRSRFLEIWSASYPGVSSTTRRLVGAHAAIIAAQPQCWLANPYSIFESKGNTTMNKALLIAAAAAIALAACGKEAPRRPRRPAHGARRRHRPPATTAARVRAGRGAGRDDRRPRPRRHDDHAPAPAETKTEAKMETKK